jgi:hypothetical protein
MKINVGDYVRTKYGIGKIINFENDLININLGYKEIIDYKTELFDITKHSKDIIDLIEVGDYVNGYKIIALQKNPTMAFCEQSYKDGRYAFANDDIKSILTHEQFEANVYTIEKER